MADASFDLEALERALLPHPDGLTAWAEQLCALDPQAGLRAAIAAARLVQPLWDEWLPERRRFALTLAAAEAAAGCPCTECAEEARHAAIRSSRELRGKCGVAPEAHRVALHAVEAASRIVAWSGEAATHVQLGCRKAAELTSREALFAAIQTEVLAWVMSEDGPIAARAEQLVATTHPPAAAPQSGAAPARERLDEIREALAPPPGGLDRWAQRLCSCSSAAGARATLAAANAARPVWLRLKRVSDDASRFQRLLDLARLATECRERCEEHSALARRASQDEFRELKGKRGHAATALRLAAWAADHASRLPREAPPLTVAKALRLSAGLSGKGETVDAVQEALLDWARSGEAEAGRFVSVLLRLPAPTAEASAVGFPGDLSAERTPQATAPDAPVPEPIPTPVTDACFEPPPARAEWKIGHTVRVRPSQEKTHLGEGVVVDLEFVRGTDTVKSALVRFEDGPADGVWYSVNTLLPLRDLFDSPLG